MIEIKDLLNRFDHLLLSEENKIETIRKIVSEIIGVDINAKDVTIKNGVIFLNIKPIYKNEVFLKQEQIAIKLEEVFGMDKFTTIR